MKFTKMLTFAVILSFVFNMAPISNASVSSGGVIGQWQNATPLPSARMDFALVRSSGNIYLVGGCVTDCFDGPTQVVETASILSNGDLGTWQSVNQLTTRRQGAAAVIAGNYLYALGGFDGQGLSSVERAPINADGTLGSWNTMQPMSISRFRFNAVVVEGYLYAIGGFSYDRNSSGETLETVERARIEADGTLGAWQPAPSLNVGRSEFVAFQANGYLYVLGGETQQNGYWISSDVIERASINPDGSIGAWQSVGIMPVGRHSFAAEYVAGDLYVMGGNTAGNPGIFHNSVDKTQVRPDGSIGSWQSMPSMLVSRYMHGAIAVDSYLYVIGGYNQTTGGLKSIERATIIIDTTPPSVTNFIINGGALASTSQSVSLTVTASDTESGVAWMSFSNDGVSWSNWASYTTASNWVLSPGDGLKTVYARIRDLAGNESAVAQSSIELNTAVSADYGFTINNGALFTNNTGVTLKISARPGTSQVQVSNDGGFADAVWEPFQVYRSWTITQYGNYVIPRVVYIRYKDTAGIVSATYQDDIILDVTPPTGSVEVTPGVSGTNATSVQVERPANWFITAPANGSLIFLPFVTKRYCGISVGEPNFTLKLSAADDVSGVGSVLISNYPDFKCAEWSNFAATQAWYVPVDANAVYVKLQDNAGNVSDIIIGNVVR